MTKTKKTVETKEELHITKATTNDKVLNANAKKIVKYVRKWGKVKLTYAIGNEHVIFYWNKNHLAPKGNFMAKVSEISNYPTIYTGSRMLSLISWYGYKNE